MEYEGRGGEHKERALRALKEKNTSPPRPSTPHPLSVFLLAGEKPKIKILAVMRKPPVNPCLYGVYYQYIFDTILIIQHHIPKVNTNRIYAANRFRSPIRHVSYVAMVFILPHLQTCLIGLLNRFCF